MDGSLLTADPTINMSYINNGIRRVVAIDRYLSFWWLASGEIGSQLQVWTHILTTSVVYGFLGCLAITASGETWCTVFLGRWRKAGCVWVC